jgi:hypothetical protein
LISFALLTFAYHSTENERTLAILHADWGDATFAAAWAEGAAISSEEAVAYALARSTSA